MNIDDKITNDQKRNFTSAFMSNLKTFYDHNFSKNKNIIYMLSHPWEFNNINQGSWLTSDDNFYTMGFKWFNLNKSKLDKLEIEEWKDKFTEIFYNFWHKEFGDLDDLKDEKPIGKPWLNNSNWKKPADSPIDSAKKYFFSNYDKIGKIYLILEKLNNLKLYI